MLFVIRDGVMKEDFTLKSRFDALGISVLATIPDDRVRAVLQISHGMYGHKERYAPMMEYLSENGIACVTADHRGHGASVRRSDDLGYMYEGGAEALVDDMEMVNCWCHERFPGLPVCLLGHSMGALASMMYTKKHDSSISGLILCGNPSRQPALSLMILLLRFIGLWNHGRYRLWLVPALAQRSLNRKFVSEGPGSWTCSDPKMRESFAADPLCRFSFTADAHLCLLSLMSEAYSDQGWNVTTPDLPVYFISGSDDPCMKSEHRFHLSAGHIAHMGYSDVSSAIYDGMRHEVLNETERISVWNDILSHINEWTANVR